MQKLWESRPFPIDISKEIQAEIFNNAVTAVSPDAWWSFESGAMGMELQPRLQQGRVTSSMPCQPGKTIDILQKLMRTATWLGSPRPWGNIPPHRVHKCQTLALRLKFVLLGFGLDVDQLLLSNSLCSFQDGKFIPLLPYHCTLQVHNLSLILQCRAWKCLS